MSETEELAERLAFVESRLANLERAHERLCQYVGREDALTAGMLDAEPADAVPRLYRGTVAGDGRVYSVWVVPAPDWDEDE